ncbi:MAG: GNAT family N-acetyltransferase [Cyanobacteria bacterium P01_F01_bin.53]
MESKVILEQEHHPTGLKIFLAPMNDSHVRHLIKLAHDPYLVELMGWQPFFSPAETAEFIEALSCFALPYSRKSQPILFGIYLDLEALPIGYAVLKGLNMDLMTAEVGLAILEKSLRTKGYGRLGLKRIVEYAFCELKIATIGAAILSSNIGSINMCKKAGFVVRETMRNEWPMPDGTLADMLWMELKHT